MTTETSIKNIAIYIRVLLYGLALAMGVATTVLSILGQPVEQILVGIAVVCLGIAGLDRVDR
ncbi:MAG: hypothetical protein ACXACI_16990 [Candidatus Hodarchaeales archaeon]|jgi:hypothetical protein